MTNSGDSQKNGNGAGSARAKPRNRASVACTQCRIRRTKCVVGEGRSECDQCLRGDSKCVLRVNDERKRPTSKAYTNSLSTRIELLEQMLVRLGQDPPPANYPPRTTRSFPDLNGDENPPIKEAPEETADLEPEGNFSSQSNDSGEDAYRNADPHSFPTHHDQYQTTGDFHGTMLPLESSQRSSTSPIPSSSSSKEKGLVDRMLSTTGHLAYDSASGRVRYFGPTTNFHVLSNLDWAATRGDTREQTRRTERIIRALPIETYNYLMDLYWTCYNSVLHVVHRQAFEEDKENGGTQYYSGWLEICLLAMGLRHADPTRPEIQSIHFWGRESDLHREAKYLFEYELEKPGGLPSIQALLMLGDLECGIGRDNTGWMYAGMACRLCFDLGLNLDWTQMGLSDREVQIRHMVLWACVVYDKYWALFLGRPTCMKSSDLAVSQLTGQFALLSTGQATGASKSLETEIYSALLDLMDLATKITERLDPRPEPRKMSASAYLAVAAVDQDLNAWYRRLPPPLKWTPANTETAPFSFFLLHQQFHAALILLHRPFTQYKSTTPEPDDQAQEAEQDVENLDHFSKLSRTICFDSAIRVARIFQTHRKRFDTRRIFVTGIQHAGAAATALIAGITQIKDPQDRIDPLKHLRTLARALKSMCPTYQPAERMSNVLEDVCLESGWDLDQLPELDDEAQIRRPTIPARRATSSDMTSSASKKRQMIAPEDNTIVVGNPFSLHDLHPRTNSFSTVIHPQGSLGGASLARHESMGWMNESPSQHMLSHKDPTTDFVGSSDHQDTTLEDMDAFGEFDLSPVEKQHDLQGQSQDLWTGIVWQMGTD